MIGRAHHHCIDFLPLIEHLAIVLVVRGLGEGPEQPRGPALVHIAQGHDVLAFQLTDILPALPADTDTGDVAWQ